MSSICPICEDSTESIINACDICETLICISCYDLSNSRIEKGKIVLPDYCKCPVCSKFIKNYDTIEFDESLVYALCYFCEFIKPLCAKDCAKDLKNIPLFTCSDCIGGLNEYKNCPHCNSPTERNGGCNHMNCAWCNGHWCWICNEGFDSSFNTEEHCIKVHNGIFANSDNNDNYQDNDNDNDNDDDDDDDDYNDYYNDDYNYYNRITTPMGIISSNYPIFALGIRIAEYPQLQQYRQYNIEKEYLPQHQLLLQEILKDNLQKQPEILQGQQDLFNNYRNKYRNKNRYKNQYKYKYKYEKNKNNYHKHKKNNHNKQNNYHRYNRQLRNNRY
jgi:hypothetical protein